MTLGIVAGLVGGKVVGITGFSWAAVRMRVGVLPEGAGWHHLTGAAAVAGIGFTVSLFIAALAFEDSRVADEAKTGILFGSLVAALVGIAVLTTRRFRGKGSR